MDWLNYDIRKIPRTGSFPFRVKMLYFSRQHVVKYKTGFTPEDMLEISIRLEPQESRCCDIINGNPIQESFPNMVWKKPGGTHRFFADRPRDAVSFGYPAELIEEFRKIGLYPEKDSMSFYMTQKIKNLLDEYRKLCLQLYTPGTADQIDWVCFHIYREILYSNVLKPDITDVTGKIRNISLWLQMHLNEPLNFAEIARANGLSRATFFRKWKEVFQITPIQYVQNLKIESAARFLAETDMPILKIVQEVHFSGTTAFHKRFYQRYGLTPKEYRLKHGRFCNRII